MTQVGWTGHKELKLTQSALICLGKYCMSTKVILEKIQVQVTSQKVTKNKSHKHSVRHMFSGSFGTYISIVMIILPYDVIQVHISKEVRSQT